jgi:hypothetical protein
MSLPRANAYSNLFFALGDAFVLEICVKFSSNMRNQWSGCSRNLMWLIRMMVDSTHVTAVLAIKTLI